jgi:hypothetical protein
MYTIFLDIDGILKPFEIDTHVGILGYEWNEVINHFSATYVAALNNIIAYIQDANLSVDIVITSDWRLNHTIDSLKEIFDKNGINSDLITGVTKDHQTRGLEILDYIKNHNINNFIVLDDLPVGAFMCSGETDRLFEGKFYRCNYNTGITASDVTTILKLL